MSEATDAAPGPKATAAEVLAAAERLADLLAVTGPHGRQGEESEVSIGSIAPAARSYEIALRRLDPATLTADLRRRLMSAGERLQAQAAEHERRLRAKVEAQRRLIACVGEAVAAAAGAGTYSRRGTMGTARPGRLPPPAATLLRAL